MKINLILITSIMFASCAVSPPSKTSNICDIYDEKRSWYRASLRTEKKWGIAPEVTMAFIKHESSYQQGAKPERTRIFFGLLPGKRKSTAYHEGMNGYKKGSYRAKPWLLSVSTNVQNTANMYSSQFEKCKKRLGSRFYFLFN